MHDGMTLEKEFDVPKVGQTRASETNLVYNTRAARKQEKGINYK